MIRLEAIMRRHKFVSVFLLVLILTGSWFHQTDPLLATTAVRDVYHTHHPTNLEELAALEGAVIDPGTGQLLLVGKPGWGTMLDMDDFKVALQLIYEGEFPAVSIDPTKDNPNVMSVRYFGDIEDTHLGFVLYEADRMLKIYSMGKDNISGESVTSGVPGYKDELELASGAQDTDEPVWHRMWFEPAELTSDAPVEAGNQRSISLSNLGVTVKTEYVSIDGSPIPGEGSDPAAEQFVTHFNDNFAAFAAERPVLQELVQVRRWLYLARWLRDAGMPVDQSWLSEEVEKVETPETTPRTSAERDLGSYRLMLGGGVDFSQENAYPEADPFAAEIREVLINLPMGQREGTVYIQGQNYVVTAVPLYEKASYTYTDENSRRWHMSAEDDRLLSLEDPEEGVTNFDEYDAEGRPLRKTINYADNQVIYAYTESGVAEEPRYATEEAARTDIPAYLQVATGELDQEPSGQAVVYERFNKQNIFKISRLKILAGSQGEQIQIAPFEVGDTFYVAVVGKNAGLFSEDDKFFESKNGRWRIYSGRSAIHASSRVLVQQYSNRERSLIHPYPGENEEFCIDIGGQTYVFDIGWEDFLDLLYDYLEDHNREAGDQLREVLAPLLNITDRPIILFSGARFPDTAWGREYEQVCRSLTRMMAEFCQESGASNIYVDDEAEEAINNLEAQIPLVNQAGDWNLEIILDNETLPDGEVADIEEIATEAGILVHTQLDTPTSEKNLMVVTGREDQYVDEVLIPSLGEGERLKDRYLILWVVEQGESDRVYAREAIVTYLASGVLVNFSEIDILDTLEITEYMVDSPSQLQNVLPGEAIQEGAQFIKETMSEGEEEFIKWLLNLLSDSSIKRDYPYLTIVEVS
jgi:hypothetical protein